MRQNLTWALSAVVAAALASMTPGGTTEMAPRFEPLPGKAVGVVVLDSGPLAAREGRSGPPGAVAFVRGAGSFRWMYLPAASDPDAEDMTFRLGVDGKTQKTFPRVRLATQAVVEPLGLTGPFHVVEVEVNGGAGSPPEEGFAATALRRLDGTKEYPLQPAKLLIDLTKRAQKYVGDQTPEIARAMAVARDLAGKGRTPTGPQESAQDVRVTWLPKEERLRVEIRCRVTNGFYVTGQGVDGPKPTVTRAGTQFGATGGVVYEVGKGGQVERETTLKFAPFTRELGLPPGVDRR